ncbi:interleukin 17a/f1 [Antennarius striatus]|uniref:interleukin 17a/f1 n=1 Tax=Antennarius striatus TaxID=241820 RepID=UPI0035B157C5
MASTTSSVTVVCVAVSMMLMMMMSAEAAAVMKHSSKTHRKSSDGATLETVPLQLDPNTLVPSRTIRPLANASISPWTYEVSHDESLFPPMLSEARCSLSGCLDKEGQEDLSLESKPIMHQVLLLRRVRSSGAGSSYHYRLESRLVAVGCTCVRPVVQQQQ